MDLSAKRENEAFVGLVHFEEVYFFHAVRKCKINFIQSIFAPANLLHLRRSACPGFCNDKIRDAGFFFPISSLMRQIIQIVGQRLKLTPELNPQLKTEKR